MVAALDTTHDCTSRTASLKAAGVHTVIRYYSRSTWKRVGAAEALALGRAGLALAAVYQNRQDRAEDFSEAQGRAAADHAHEYASQVIFQPTDTAIYFAADFDPTEAVVTQKIKPFLKGVAEVFKQRADGGGPAYRVGLYGSGRTLRIAKADGLSEYFWLSQSTGHAEHRKFRDSGDWHLLQLAATIIAGISCDPDEINPAHGDVGAFSVTASTLGAAAPSLASTSSALGHERFITLARSGLRLRSGPGMDFDVAGLLPLGTEVSVVSRSGAWSMVDVSGDGAVDGFVHSTLIRPA